MRTIDLPYDKAPQVTCSVLVGVQVDDVGGRGGRVVAGPAARAPALAQHHLARALLLQRHGHRVAAAQPSCVELGTHLLLLMYVLALIYMTLAVFCALCYATNNQFEGKTLHKYSIHFELKYRSYQLRKLQELMHNILLKNKHTNINFYI